MNKKLQLLLEQMKLLEEEIEKTLSENEEKILFAYKGRKIVFDQKIKIAHKELRQSFYSWLKTRPQNLITGPIIYSMIIPMLILDVSVSFYQWACFPIYKISKVKRSDYILIDRHHLHYLNLIEKFHCTYCAYGAGLLAYISEIVGRTEQYFCPIKHARKMLGTHDRYSNFLAFGEANGYEKKLENFRKQLSGQ